MSAEPESIHHLEIQKDLLKDSSVIAAVDRGSSLLKLLFVTRNDFEESKHKDTMTLTVELFGTKHFESGIDSLLRQMYMPEDASNVMLKVTGAGAAREIELLKNKTPFNVVFVDEDYCQSIGNSALIKHWAIDEICHPLNEFEGDTGLIDDTIMKKMNELIDKQQLPNSDQDFPCLISSLGSASVFRILHEDGMSHPVGSLPLSGKSFLGLAKLLLNTKDYDEIMKLADKGYRGNVDTQIKEVLSNKPGSTYGLCKPEMCIFLFGKPYDYDQNVEDFSREDVAASLLAAMAGTVIDKMDAYVSETKCARVFLGGNMFLSPVFRRYFADMFAVFGFQRKYTVRLLKVGYAGALGALLADPEKEKP